MAYKDVCGKNQGIKLRVLFDSMLRTGAALSAAPAISRTLLLATHPNTDFRPCDVPALGFDVLAQDLGIDSDAGFVFWLQFDPTEEKPWTELGWQVATRRILGEPECVPGFARFENV